MIVQASHIISIALIGVIGLLAAVVMVRLFDGTIVLGGMLAHDSAGGTAPDRILMMGLTLFSAVTYLSYGLAHGASDGTLPDIPDDMRSLLLTAVSGSNAFYLFQKFTFNGGTS